MKSMEEIYSQYAKMIYGFLLVRTGEEDLAEELTQETFYQALKSLSRFDGKSALSTWLCGIAKNVWYTHLRKQKKYHHIPLEEIPEQSEPLSISLEQEVLNRLESRQIKEQMDNMKEPARTVMYLRLIEDLSFRQIGEIMEKSETWARVTFYRGKERLLKEVTADER